MVKLQTIRDARGCLTVVEKLPFHVKRAYFLHHITGPRGGHAHKTLDRLLIAVSGSFLAVLNGAPTRLWTPEEAIRVPPMTWLDLRDFSSDAVAMVLASAEYDPDDYIRDITEFEKLGENQ